MTELLCVVGFFLSSFFLVQIDETVTRGWSSTTQTNVESDSFGILVSI